MAVVWMDRHDLSEVDFDRIHLTFLGHRVNPRVDDPELWALYQSSFRKGRRPPSGRTDLIRA